MLSTFYSPFFFILPSYQLQRRKSVRASILQMAGITLEKGAVSGSGRLTPPTLLILNFVQEKVQNSLMKLIWLEVKWEERRGWSGRGPNSTSLPPVKSNAPLCFPIVAHKPEHFGLCAPALAWIWI